MNAPTGGTTGRDAGSTPRPGTPLAAQMRGIRKAFSGVVANDDVHLDVRPGEIHALLGENGAGKSTLMNVLTGLYRPDAGEIVIEGYGRTFEAPSDAIAAGIGMVHQHFKLVQAFTVAENIHLGWGRTPRWVSAPTLRDRTVELARRFNLEIRPDVRVRDLSAGEQQRVEILRVLSRQARILILDEPTAVLTPSESVELFKALRAFRSAGNAVILITHKLNEVMASCDRVTVLRRGRRIATERVADCSAKQLANMMIGRDIVGRPRRRGEHGAGAGPVVLRLEGVSARDDQDLPALHAIDLDLHAGEILGIAGVAGNGQRELSEVLSGMRQASAGRIVFGTDVINGVGAAGFAARGVGHIPEDRLRTGLAPSLSITDNAVLREYGRPPLARGPFFRPKAATAAARAMAAAASVTLASPAMPVRNLSGGNQQRLVCRREMRIASRVLIAAYPSRGLDVGAVATVMQSLEERRDAGVAVMLLSEDLEEILDCSDRIAVLFGGRVMGVLPRSEADAGRLGMMMGGRMPGSAMPSAAGIDRP